MKEEAYQGRKAQLEAQHLKPVTLWIPEDLQKECRLMGWTYREVFIRGVQAKRGDPQIQERIQELEQGNKKLHGKLTQFYNELAKIGGEK